MKIEIKNTYEEWCKAKRLVEKEVIDKKLTSLQLEVTAECDNSSEQSDINLFIYLFPIIDVAHDYFAHVREATGNEPDIERSEDLISLNIKLDTKRNASEDVQRKMHQIQHFFYLYQTINGLQLSVNNTMINASQVRFGHIVPAIEVNSKGLKNFYYQNIMYSEAYNKTIIVDLNNICKQYISSPSYNDMISSDVMNNLQNYENIINLNFLSSMHIDDSSAPLPLASMFMIDKNDSPQIIYTKFTLSNAVYTATHFQGTSSQKLNRTQKQKLCEAFFDFIIKNIAEVPLLAQYIWTILIRYLSANKQLIEFKEGNPSLSEELMKKTLSDSLSFAEGLYQVIENACMHSRSHRGYFYIRIYDTDMKSTGDKLIHNATTLKRLTSKYNGITSFNNVDQYLEITFVDNTFDLETGKNIGMINHYNNHAHGLPVRTLQELFSRRAASPADVTEHYGLRVFERTVFINRGGFFVSTPDNNEYSVINNRNKHITTEIELSRPIYNGTVYQIILPIYTKRSTYEDRSQYELTNIFETEDIEINYTPFKINLKTRIEFSSFEEKQNVTEALYNEFTKAVKKIANPGRRIICVRTESFRYHTIELLAKTIMRYAIHNSGSPNKIAILFDNRHYINEFIRVYAAFFDVRGENYEGYTIDNTQIALCSMRNGIPEVNLVLSGNNIMTAQQTARSYAYYNADSAMEFIPMINHLTGYTKGTDNAKIKPVFPFDLYLDLQNFDADYDNEKTHLTESNRWFFRQIEKILNTDMQKAGYGCRLNNVHISIGSKIHIESFYNAELLFHNYAIISRFAYLIAKTIINEHKSDEHRIALIAYSDYSLLLIQQVKAMIEESINKADFVDYLIFPPVSDVGSSSDTDDGLWPDFSKFISDKKTEDYKFYVILPIATTLTTVGKIRNIMKKICRLNGKNEPVFGNSISMIVVGGTRRDDSLDIMEAVRLGYWERANPSGKEIIFNKHLNKSNDASRDRIVKYFFNTSSKWYKANDCELCRNFGNDQNIPPRSIIGVDKTSTLPSAIFETFNNKKKMFGLTPSEYIENESRVENFRGCIKYSHISNEDNHFQFNIDYNKYCENEEVRRSIASWLKNYVRPHINANAFNIIISPLNRANSIFLKSVIDNAFESSIRLLNIQINTSFREEIRTKFNYITEEYTKMKDMIGNVKINVYYVDDCIVSGATLQRGKQFINMLLMQNTEDMSDISLYEGVILLANRSSYETIQNLLPGDIKNRFFYYVRLNVPSYNTRNGICPACDLANQYKRMHKRSSTHIIADEYIRLIDKHSYKTREEYDTWLEKKILNKKSYARWFMQWLYYTHTDYSLTKEVKDKNGEQGIGIEYVNVLCQRETFKLFDRFESMIKNTDVENGKPFNISDKKEIITDCIKKCILEGKDYMRMYCTHTLFMKLEDVMCNADSTKDAETDTRKRMLNIIKDKFKEIDDKTKTYPKRISLWLKSEWLISYIKIASRKQLSKYYHIRNAIYGILLDIAVSVTDNGIKPKTDIKFITEFCRVDTNNNSENSVMPEMKYTILLIVIRRLSAMHSNFVIEKSEDIYNFYLECKKQFYGYEEYSHFYTSGSDRELYRRLISFPDEIVFCFNMTKLIKWTAMSGYDESKCFAIESKFKKTRINPSLLKLPPQGSENTDQLAFLENTQVIYFGVQRLLEGYDKDINNFEELKDYIQNIYDNIRYSDNGDIRFYEMNMNKLFFGFMEICYEYNTKAYKAVLIDIYASMCRYYYELKKLDSLKHIARSPYPYETICNCIRDITGYEQCSIVYSENGKNKILVTSDMKNQYLNVDLNYDIILKLVEEFKKNAADKNGAYINRIVQKYSTDIVHQADGILYTAEVVLIDFPISGNNEEMPENGYIIIYKIFKHNNSVKSDINLHKLNTNELWNIRNVLFLRESLAHILRRDIVTLNDMTGNYGYIKPLNGQDGIKILHISDLHINKANEKKIIQKIEDEKDELCKINPDLLLISGDVIQGSYMATDLTNNYKSATNVIKCLVKYIWGDERSGTIRGDWKKRIVISTGNHDYASMNELRAQNMRRMTTSGTPGDIGNALIKYSYYVNFLHSLLGKDIDDILRYDLNELIHYKGLKISVANINSNSGVNPYRTNKVQINSKCVEQMFEQNKHTETVVYMVHHSPMYVIDYIGDIYYSCISKVKAELDTIKNENPNLHNKSCEEIWIKLIKAVQNDFTEILFGMDKETQETIFYRFLSKIKKGAKEDFDGNNLSDFEYYLSVKPEDRVIDDRCQQIVSAVKEHIKLSEADLKAYTDFIKLHFEKKLHKHYIVSGHTHRPARYTGLMVGALSNCLGICEAGKFYVDENTDLNYGVLQINDGSTGNYEFIPSTDVEAISSNDALDKIT